MGSWSLPPSAVSTAATPVSSDTFFSYNSGQDYIQFSEDQRDVYIQGLMDQWSLMLAIYDDFESLIWLEECTTHWRSDQVAEIFTDWLELHSDSLELSASELFVAAMIESCVSTT